MNLNPNAEILSCQLFNFHCDVYKHLFSRTIQQYIKKESSLNICRFRAQYKVEFEFKIKRNYRVKNWIAGC